MADLSLSFDPNKISAASDVASDASSKAGVALSNASDAQSAATAYLDQSVKQASGPTFDHIHFGVGLMLLHMNAKDNLNVGSGFPAFTSAGFNTSFGLRSHEALTEGAANTAFGYQAQVLLTTGGGNTAFGYITQSELTEGDFNTAFGSGTQDQLKTGDENTAFGRMAGWSNITGSRHVCLGAYAGYYEKDTDDKLFIDNRIRASQADARLKALIYGIFDDDTADQYLYFNSHLYVREDLTIAALAGVLKGTAGVVSAITNTTSADYLGGDMAYHTLNQAAVVGLTTADGPTFDHVHLTTSSYCGGNLIFSGAATRNIQHSVDDQSIYVNAGTAFNKGASIQFYGEDQASFPGDVYIIAGSSDRAALGSIVELAFRDAGTYRKLLTLTYAATPVALVTGSLQCTTGFGCNSKTAQTAYASGGAVAPGAGAFGASSAILFANFVTLVTNIRLALVANGIMS